MDDEFEYFVESTVQYLKRNIDETGHASLPVTNASHDGSDTRNENRAAILRLLREDHSLSFEIEDHEHFRNVSIITLFTMGE